MPKILLEKITQVKPFLDERELEPLRESIDNKWLTEGPWSKLFLERLKEFTGSPYAVLAPNGTLGLFLGILALDLPRGSEIIMPSFTFFASASSAYFAGLRPVFVDVDDDTFNIDVNLIEEAINENTSAIMPVHIYGHSCRIDEVIRISEKHGLKVIEDAAQSLGVFYNGSHTGTFGDTSAISFFADKTVTTGEGAVVFARDEVIYDRLLCLRNQGRKKSGSFIHPEMGMNFRITDMQCAVGLSQMDKFEAIRQKRLRIDTLYREGLNGVGDIRFLKVENGSTFVPFRFVIRTESKDALISHLEACGIETRSFFYPMHLQPPFRGNANKSLPVSEGLYSSGICLPLHHYLKEDDIYFIVQKIREFFGE